MKTWQGRIEAGAHPLFEAFTSSAAQDVRLAPYDVRVNRAQIGALQRAGLVTADEADRLTSALDEIDESIRAGRFQWRDDLEDVHTHIESALRSLVGTAADKLHTGRSRNDQVAADLRLYVKEQASQALRAVLSLQAALLGLAERCGDAIMPGYTHLQQAQPVLIAHVLDGWIAMLDRDWERLWAARERADVSPLGSGALAGATFDLDRALLAELAGFGGVSANSLDSVGDRDFAVEFVGAAALCMTHLSRMSEDLILWSSTELGFVRLPDAFASGSSMMPQKKNPDVAELIRGKTALVIGDATALLTMVKGLPGGYNRDLQEDKTPLYHAADALLGSLQILAALAPELEFDVARAEATVSAFAMATDLADHLVRQGVAFREAHGVVARLVTAALAGRRSLADLTDEELAAASPHLRERPALDARSSVRLKRTAGSTHPDQVALRRREARALVEERCAALDGEA